MLTKIHASAPLRICFVSVAVIATAGLLYAQFASVDNGPSFSLPPQVLLDEAGPSASSASNAIILLDEEAWTFQPEGGLRKTSHLLLKVLTAEGVEEWASINRRWEPWREKRPVIRARVVTPNGIAHELDQQTITDAPASSGEPETYSDARLVRCPLPAVSVGSVVEEEISEEATPLVGTGIVAREFVGWSVPVRSMRLIIRYPKSLPLRYKSYLLPELQVVSETHEDTVQLTLTAAAIRPPKPAPPLMPSDVPMLPEIIFTTSASWAENASNYSALVDRQIADAPIANLVDEAKTAAKSRKELIAALLRKVQTQIRYTGVEFGDAAIIPAQPGQTLKREYGDCKDKAAVLVAMLRGAGIPAHLALLNAGFSEDVNPDFPGLDFFNHAIVFVPAASPSEPELWIDATAEYLRLGFLPSGDQGRLALIIDGATTHLKKIPDSPSSASKTTETREFFLPDVGPARVVEISGGVGTGEEWYRANFGSADTDETRKNLRSYLQSEYVSESHDVKIEHSKGDDFSKSFYLRLEIDKAKRGATSEMDGTVWIPLASLLSRLPAYFKIENAKKSNETDESDDGPAKPRSADFVLPEAFTAEWYYRIHLPPGFHAKELPSPASQHLGPALLMTEYHAEGEEIIATLKFDTGKRRLTPDEAEVLRKAVVDIEKQSALPLTFESTGKTLLDGGHIREALAQFASMAAKYPKKAIYQVQMSRALSEASCGDEARKQARLATQLEPNSAPAWHNLGVVLSRDLIGHSFHKGSDPRGAEAAYRKAMSLDPKDYAIQGDLAILLEFDSNGERYSPSARINEAVEIYLSIKDELPALGLGDNLLYALAYARRFPELKEEAEKLDRSHLRSEMILVANAALSGTSSALRQLDSDGLSAQDRFTVIQTASTIFLRMRMYQQTSDLLQAAAPLSDQAAQIAARAELLRKVKVFEPVKLRMDSPLSAFLSMLAASITSDDEKLTYHTFLARESAAAFASEDQEESASIRDHQQMFRAMSSRAGIPMPVMLDFFGSLAQAASEPNGDDGFRVHLTIFGAPPITLYYVVEAGQYKLLGDDSDYSGIARRVLKDVDSGKLEVARRWLDWLREEIKLKGGDDPIAGPVFPRFWTKGEQGDEKKIRSAAATLLGSTADSDKALPLLQEALRSANDASFRTAAELAYAVACLRFRKFSEAVHPALELAKLYPDSVTAFGLVFQAFADSSDWSGFETFAKQHLEKNPDEPAYGRALAENAGLQGRFEEAESRYHAIAQSSKGGVQDWNGFGWNAVLAGTVTLAKIQEVQQGLNLASAQAQQPPAGVLHTLAAMYAEIGKTNEAREIIFRAMDSWQIDEPNEACWLVFGRIAEQLAVPDTALADYRRITQPKIKSQEKESNYYIAQQRIAVLEKNRSNDLASLK